MEYLTAALTGAFLFAAGLVVGHRTGSGREPVTIPRLAGGTRREPKEPEEKGWATREQPHVDEVTE